MTIEELGRGKVQDAVGLGLSCLDFIFGFIAVFTEIRINIGQIRKTNFKI